MSLANKRTAKTHLICSDCGTIYPMIRVKAMQKKDGHIKNLWCYRCKEVKPHVENKEGTNLL